MKIEFGNSIRRLSFLCCLLDIKIAWINSWVYSHYGIAFDGAGSWNFVNDFAKNVVIFGVANSLSSHTDKCKNHFLVLGEGPS